MSRSFCRLCGQEFTGTHACNGTGNWGLIDMREVDKLRARIAELEEKLHLIDNWCKAYPLDIAPEPDKETWKKANEILDDNGISFSQLNISTMRHVIDGVARLLNLPTEDK